MRDESIKYVYLVHLYKSGIYHSTSSVAFVRFSEAEKYARDCIFQTQIEKVDLIYNY